jgi:hypothetical protein
MPEFLKSINSIVMKHKKNRECMVTKRVLLLKLFPQRINGITLSKT